MGYMGLGYQKWISSQRPRKPFSKDRKPAGGTSGQTSITDFTPHRATKKKKGFNVRALLLIIFLVSALVYIHSLWSDYVERQNENYKRKLAYQKQYPKIESDQLLNYLNKSASLYIRKGELNLAKLDLKLAEKQRPSNLQTSQLWMVLYLTECNLGTNCDSATYFLNKHFTTFPNDTSAQMQSLKQAYESQDFNTLTTLLSKLD